MNVNWIRWIEASIQEHCRVNRGDLKMQVENGVRDTREEGEFFELRIDGPDIIQEDSTNYCLTVTINILVQVAINNEDFHRPQQILGAISTNIMVPCIPVYKYGDGEDDDQTLLGVLTQDSDSDKPVEIHRFGMIDTKTRLDQSTIEAQYTIELEGD